MVHVRVISFHLSSYHLKKNIHIHILISLKNELFDSKFNIAYAELRNSLINVNFWDLNNLYTSNIMEMKRTGFSGMY